MQIMQHNVQSTATACHAFYGTDPAEVCLSLCSNGAAEGHAELPIPAACFPFATPSPRLSKHGSGGADLIWRMDGSEQQQHSTGKPVLRSISLVSCSPAHGAAHRCLRAAFEAEPGALGCSTVQGECTTPVDILPLCSALCMPVDVAPKLVSEHTPVN